MIDTIWIGIHIDSESTSAKVEIQKNKSIANLTLASIPGFL